MEELYALLTDRLTSIQDFVQKFDLIINQFEADPLFSLLPPQLNELSVFINNLKKTEKIRVLRENDFLEMIFTLPNFDSAQLMRFQEKSYEIMQKIVSEFVYEKNEPTGEIIDVFRLYYRFFQHLEMYDKIEDMRRVYNNIKLANFPSVSMLIKWLIEIARKHYQDYLKYKSQQLSLQMSKPPMHPSETKGTGGETNQEKESSTISFQAKIKEFNEDISRKQFQKQLYAPGPNSNVALRQILSQLVSRGEKPKRGQSEENSLNLSKGDLSISPPKKPRFSFIPQKATDSLPVADACPRYLTINTPEQQQGNYLDIIDDLDYSGVTSMVISPNKLYSTRKLSGPKILDFERRKEFTVQYYRALYLRNIETERSINNYKLELREKKKIEYDPNQLPLRGELYTETITVLSLIKRFAFAITEESKLKYPTIFPAEVKATSCILDDAPPTRFRVTTNSRNHHRSATPNRPITAARGQNEKKLPQGTLKEVDIFFKPPKAKVPVVQKRMENLRESKQKARETSLRQDTEESFESSAKVRDTEPSFNGLDLYRIDTQEAGDLKEISTNSYQPIQKKAITQTSTIDVNENSNTTDRTITQPESAIMYSILPKKTKPSYLTPVKSISPKNRKFVPHFRGADRLERNNLDYAGVNSSKNCEATVLLSSLFYHVPETRSSRPVDLLRHKESPSLDAADRSKDDSPKKRVSLALQKNSFSNETSKNDTLSSKLIPSSVFKRSYGKEKFESPVKKSNVYTASSLTNVDKQESPVKKPQARSLTSV